MTADITVVLTNWKRRDNLKKIVQDLRRQTVPLIIQVWDNSGVGQEDEDVDLWITSSKNVGCTPRWRLIQSAGTKWACFLDDDLTAKSRAFELAMQIAEDTSPLGIEGRKYLPNKPYKDAVKVEDGECDVILGRFWFLRTSHAQKLNLDFTIDPMVTWEDVAGSTLFTKKYISKQLRKMFVNLPTGDESLWKRGQIHFDEREAARQRYSKCLH